MFGVDAQSNRLEVMIAPARPVAWATGLVQRLEPLPVALHWPASMDAAVGLVAGGRVHVGVVDGDTPNLDGGLSLVRRIRRTGHPLPCLLVCSQPSTRLLRDALELNVFSVLAAEAGSDPIADMVMRVGRQVFEDRWPAGFAGN